MSVLIPIAIKVGIPLAIYAIGHFVGWVHHEIHDAKLAKQKDDAMRKAMQRPAGE